MNSSERTSPARRHVRVVIADDHQMFREAVACCLAREPDLAVVAQAGDGEELMSRLASTSADVLLLDLAMPRMSGFKVLRRLSAAVDGQLRTIVLTGCADRSDIVHALNLGARGVVLKSGPLDLLPRSIRAVAAGEFWIGHEFMADVLRGASAAACGARRPADTLTPRELQIVKAVLQGATNRQIGQQFTLSEQTIKNHLSSIFDKLGVSNRLELALFAVNHQLLAVQED